MTHRLRLENPEYAELVLAVVVVWGVCDGLSMVLAAEFAGRQLEANPLMRALLATPPLALAVKLGGVLAAGALALAGERFIRTVPGWRVWFAVLIGVGIAVTTLNLLVAFALV
ncbi:hypothetical protein [Halococcus sp. AFM35]|uniref:hypothetical protein n=1 Tax=Halococcus sp. AFM35 TaxID=3421653 RepID=UPI003EBBB769